jgi:hypothetical protein
MPTMEVGTKVVDEGRAKAAVKLEKISASGGSESKASTSAVEPRYMSITDWSALEIIVNYE